MNFSHPLLYQHHYYNNSGTSGSHVSPARWRYVRSQDTRHSRTAPPTHPRRRHPSASSRALDEWPHVDMHFTTISRLIACSLLCGISRLPYVFVQPPRAVRVHSSRPCFLFEYDVDTTTTVVVVVLVGSSHTATINYSTMQHVLLQTRSRPSRLVQL